MKSNATGQLTNIKGVRLKTRVGEPGKERTEMVNKATEAALTVKIIGGPVNMMDRYVDVVVDLASVAKKLVTDFKLASDPTEFAIELFMALGDRLNYDMTKLDALKKPAPRRVIESTYFKDYDNGQQFMSGLSIPRDPDGVCRGIDFVNCDFHPGCAVKHEDCTFLACDGRPDSGFQKE